jgi:UDP-glucose 4-epimerase
MKKVLITGGTGFITSAQRKSLWMPPSFAKTFGVVISHELAPGGSRTVGWNSKNYEAVKGRRKFADA